jgi:LuxR family maltose regulon positive regulatory protein
LRARGQLAELRAADLRFNAEEVAGFLRGVWGLDLAPQAVGVLEARTEGWAAGLQLAALSLQGRPDPEAFVAAFSGSHRYVLDYLSQEVLERQPASVRRFLLETSVLERLCGPLCDAVTGRFDGQQLLEELERANLFLVPLDQERRWWRYHHLFAELLRARLRQAAPDREPQLHRRAAAWCQEHGLVDDAIRHAVAAGDPGWAAGLVERHVEELLLWRCEAATVARWLAALPGQVVGSRPRLSLAQATAALMEGRLEAMEPSLAAAQATAADAGEPHQPSVGRSASILANVPATTAVLRGFLARFRGDLPGVRAFAEQAMAHLTSPASWPATSLESRTG